MSIRHRASRRHTLFGFLGSCVSVLALTACGGGGESAPEAQASAAAAPVAAASVASAPSDASTLASPRAGADALATGFAAGQVKWHPGHYVTLLQGQAPKLSHMQTVIAELQQHPNLRGVQIRYPWAELEPSQGVYDFSRIQRDLDLLAPTGKRLFILLQTKAFDNSYPVIPSYLDSGAEISGGGSFPIISAAYAGAEDTVATGRNIKLWNRNVRERLTALIKALGSRFNKHATLEGLALTETAMGTPVGITVTTAQQTAFYDNLLLVNRNLRAAFPNTVTMQFTNYPMNILSTFVTGLRASGSGLGGPDIFLSDQDLLNGVYMHYPQQAGQLPLGPSVQGENYERRYYGGPDNPPSIDALYHFGRDNLRANYIFWTRKTSPEDSPYQRLLNYISSPDFPAGAAGGLATACPRAYVSCVN